MPFISTRCWRRWLDLRCAHLLYLALLPLSGSFTAKPGRGLIVVKTGALSLCLQQGCQAELLVQGFCRDDIRNSSIFMPTFCSIQHVFTRHLLSLACLIQLVVGVQSGLFAFQGPRPGPSQSTSSTSLLLWVHSEHLFLNIAAFIGSPAPNISGDVGTGTCVSGWTITA